MTRAQTERLARRYSDTLRKRPTKATNVFRKLLNSVKIPFKSEKVIFKEFSFFIIDFFLKRWNLCIEIDGGYHNEPSQKAKDKDRDRQLQARGYQVWRMTNEEALTLTSDDLIEKLNSFTKKTIVIREIAPLPEKLPRHASHKKGNPRSKRRRHRGPKHLPNPNLPSIDQIRTLKQFRDQRRIQ